MKNFTPHSIKIIDPNIVVFDKNIRKYVPKKGVEINVVKEITSDGMLSAKIKTELDRIIDGVPVFKKQVIKCDPLPKGNDSLIVSAIYAVAAKKEFKSDSHRLFVISDPVFTPDGTRVLGCLGISPAL